MSKATENTAPAPVTGAQTMNFYELSAELATIEAELAEAGGEITPEQEERYLAVVKAHLQKAENLIGLIKRSEHMQAMIKAEADRLAAQARTFGNMVKGWKSLVKAGMKAAGQTKIQTARGRLQIQSNGGKQPLVLKDGVTVATIADRYVKVEVVKSIDTEALRAHLESGDEKLVKQAEEYAYLAERGDQLRIY